MSSENTEPTSLCRKKIVNSHSSASTPGTIIVKWDGIYSTPHQSPGSEAIELTRFMRHSFSIRMVQVNTIGLCECVKKKKNLKSASRLNFSKNDALEMSNLQHFPKLLLLPERESLRVPITSSHFTPELHTFNQGTETIVTCVISHS